MREFIILIGELLFVAAIQAIIEAIMDERGLKRQMQVVNIACILISYILLIRYVNNHLLGEISALVNLYF